MKNLNVISNFILLAVLFTLHSCNNIFGPTDKVIYYNSFESESDLNDWMGLFPYNLHNDTHRSGGKKSVLVSGGCKMPTAKYTFKPVGVEQKVSFSFYGKMKDSGGIVFICIEDDTRQEIRVQVKHKSWTHYMSKESIVWPADKDLSICLFSGGISGGSMLIDNIKIIKNE